MNSISTCLMFVGDHAGKAHDAITFYTELFNNSELLSVEWHEASANEVAGTVKFARFSIAGVQYIAMDSSHDHAFTFTPATSQFVDCDSIEEIEYLYQALQEEGDSLMPLGEYGFSRRFGWVNDRFGVSWQLNLE